ncbi:MAG: HEAT repeat domain-containing protein, partial [Gemmatimonadales bacterium]
MTLRIAMVLTGIAAWGAVRASAQDPALVEALAPVLMAEDRRAFDPAVLEQALANPDPAVREAAALSVGRLGDRRGVPLLRAVLTDSADEVVADAFFAFGLLRDTAAVEPIIARLRAPDPLPPDAIAEAATALARIGGDKASGFIAGMLTGATDVARDRIPSFIPTALLDGWHLGARMPVAAMIHYTSDTSADLRWRALYALGRLRIPAAGRAVLNGLRDQTPVIRETCAKWLTRQFADTAGVPAANARSELVRALDDDQPGVRVNAAASLATFADSGTSTKLIPLLSDGDQNVRVAAASALGLTGGDRAAQALDALFDKRDATWALRRAALAALVRIDTARFARRVAPWLASGDPIDRIAALGILSARRPGDL